MNKKLRIVIITMGLSCIVKPLVESQDEVVGIVECAPRNGVQAGLLREFLDFIKNIIKWHMNLKGYAKQKRIPYMLLDKNNHNNVSEMIKGLNPDLIVVFSMSQLLRENIFSIPRLGTINLHPSLLPAYRGPDPTIWQYVDLMLHPGVTVHYIDEGEDTGDILAQSVCEISLGEPLERYNQILQSHGVVLLRNVIAQLRAGKAKGKKQSRESSTPRSRLLKQGESRCFIQWKLWSVKRIWHILHGLNTHYDFLVPPKFTALGMSWRIGDWEECKENHIPEDIYIENGKRYIACKDGRIRLYMSFSLRKLLHNLRKLF